MDSPDIYPDALGDALSYSSQRLAQLGSLVTAAATMEVRRRAQASAANAARSQHELRALQAQQRAGWAPAHDPRWLAQAELLQAARVWSAATTYADADPAAASAARKCEERLRVLHPYAMARYDRLRSEGAGAFEAMRQAVPLFGRAPYARPGDRAAERRVLEAPARLDAAAQDGGAPGGVGQPGPDAGPDRQLEQRGYQIVQELQARVVAERGYALSPDELATTLGATTTLPGDVIAVLARANDEEGLAGDAEQARADDLDRVSAVPSTPDGAMPSELLAAASQDKLDADTADAHVSSDRTAAQLAAESFPCTASGVASANARAQAGLSGTRTVTAHRIQQPGRST